MTVDARAAGGGVEAAAARALAALAAIGQCGKPGEVANDDR